MPLSINFKNIMVGENNFEYDYDKINISYKNLDER
jgi:hypothetical protein